MHIEYITVSNTLGNSQDFGNLTAPRRGSKMVKVHQVQEDIAMGGDEYSNATVTTIELCTLHLQGSATDFGSIYCRAQRDWCWTGSNQTRALLLVV